jgi:hypothetical protein
MGVLPALLKLTLSRGFGVICRRTSSTLLPGWLSVVAQAEKGVLLRFDPKALTIWL